MITDKYDLSIDLKLSYRIPPMVFIQNDSKVYFFDITITSDNIPVDLTGCIVTLRFKKVDGTQVEGTTLITDAVNGKVTYMLGTNEIACVGKVIVLPIVYGSNGERKTANYPFGFLVKDDMDNGTEIPSTTEYAIITDLINDVNLAKEDIGVLGSVNTQIQNDITLGNQLHSNLTSNINNGQNLNNNIINNIATGNTLKTILENTIVTAENTKNELQNTNTTANQTKQSLDTSNTTATNTKTALEGTIVNASNKATDLQNVIATANTTTYATKGEINSVNTQLADRANEINALGVNKADKTEVNALATAKANQTQADNIQAQINSLVVGSGTSSAEVVQARVDSVGNTSSTIKGTIDSIDKIARTGVINGFIKSWVIGTMDANGVNATSNVRLRTDFQNLLMQSIVPITIASGYKFKYYYFDKNKNYIGQTGWLTASTNLTVEYPYYRFLLSKADDTTIALTDCDNITVINNIETDMLKSFKYVNTDIITLGSFQYGNINSNDTLLVGNTNRLSIFKIGINKNDRVGFANNLNNKYKFAIDKAGDNALNFIQSDSGSYHLKPYKVNETAQYNFMIAKIDNTDFTSAEVTEINNNFGILTIKTRLEDIEVNTTNNLLYEKKIGAIGDSFVDYNTVGSGKCWLDKIANRNGMTVYNYGLSSSSLAYDPNQTVLSVMDRYQSMISEAPNLDYVLVLAGHNDSNASLHGGTAIPIGSNADTVNTTFKGALNILIKALLDAYPLARIVFLTPFNRRGTELPYVDAMKEICGLYSIPCFDNYRGSGVCFQNSNQRVYYDLNNTLHLTELGNEFVSYKYESLLKSM